MDQSKQTLTLWECLSQGSKLVVNPHLAKAIGLIEALLLRQCAYWQSKSGREHKGRLWFYKTDQSWLEDCPFLSLSTLRRAMKNLDSMGLIKREKLSGEILNDKYNRVNWYSVDLDLNLCSVGCVQNEHIEEIILDISKCSKVKKPSSQNEQNTSSQNEQMSQETTQETTKKYIKKRGKQEQDTSGFRAYLNEQNKYDYGNIRQDEQVQDFTPIELLNVKKTGVIPERIKSLGTGEVERLCKLHGIRLKDAR